MTAHTHTEFVPECFRCDLSRAEVDDVLARECVCGDLYAWHSLERLAECMEQVKGGDE